MQLVVPCCVPNMPSPACPWFHPGPAALLQVERLRGAKAPKDAAPSPADNFARLLAMVGSKEGVGCGPCLAGMG